MRTVVSKAGAALALALGIAVMGGSIIGGIALAADRGPDRSPAVTDPSPVEEPSVNATSPASPDDDVTDDHSYGATDDDGDDHDTSTGTDDDDDHGSSSTGDPSATPSGHEDHPEDDD